MQETQEVWVWSLSWEDALEEGMSTHFSILAWKIPMDSKAWRATVHGVTKSWKGLKWLSTAQCIAVNPGLPISQFIPPLFPPLVSIHLFSTSVSLFLLFKYDHLHQFFSGESCLNRRTEKVHCRQSREKNLWSEFEIYPLFIAALFIIAKYGIIQMSLNW